MKVSGRLIIAIFSTLLEEAGIAAIVLWGLPYLGVYTPLAGLIVLMVAWGAYAAITYRMGSRALMRKPVAGLGDVIGSRGKVVSRLAPNGVIRIGSELWEATSDGRRIKAGEEVTVLGRDGLKLIVHKSNSSKRK
ncbi:MAG: NfeD family protein [Dehalococcoidales bacterium]|nr:NfeD family protein [Dehalococcoidales bacterium]